ncbi:replication initiator protein A [Rhodopirellula baltica]|uniref:Replication initiator protein A n=1 Tax=Rhodopirellula baltica SWK14 TaxID=993516 RepID=L7CLQ8_RHOBT|nr:replication initiator protein A [Rhodopirellula baltica]ELP34542.1 hypothetical protein RBSWK_01552 [Rhodopirellula baltica SWK14]
MATAVAPTKEVEKFDRTQGRDELNLAEFPLFYLGQRVPKGLTSLTYETELSDTVRNRTVNRRFEIVATEKYGLPTVVDADVFFALILIGKQTHNLTSQTISFSRYQLCELLGWTQSGANYKRIETALKKWVSTTLFYDQWWDKGEDRLRKLTGFHLFSKLELNDHSGRTKQLELPLSSLRLSDELFQSVTSGTIKRLNLADFFHLQLPIAKQLYRFLDKRFYRRNTLTFDLQTLAFEHVGMSRNYAPSKIKDKMKPAIKELVDLGFIEDASPEERFTKRGHGVYDIHFRKVGGETIGVLPLPGSKAERSENRQLVKALVDHGVTASTARELVENPDIENDHIRLQIEVLEWKISDPDENPPSRPGGYLRKAITESYDPPKNFKPKQEREAEAKRVMQAMKERKEAKALRDKAEQDRLDAEANAKAKQQARVNAYLAKLSSNDRETLIDQAIADAPEGMFKSYAVAYRRNPKVGAIKKVGYDAIIEAHVLRLLSTSDDA